MTANGQTRGTSQAAGLKQASSRQTRIRIFATCDIGEQALNRLRRDGFELEVHPELQAPSHDLIVEKVASGIDALITTLRDRIDEAVFRAGAGTLKVLGQDAVGTDNIDLEAASRHRIPVVNTPDVLTDATAEFALFMLGCVARRLYSSERLVREGKWRIWHPSIPFLGVEVTGKTVGIVGLGRIGKAFALKCSGLEMDILVSTRSPDAEFGAAIQRLLDQRHSLGLGKRRSRFEYVGFEDCLERSDFLSLHVPLTAQTRGMIDAAALRRMKPTSFLINTTRGAVVEEAALHQALLEGRIAGAALDVFVKEPLPDDSPLQDPRLEDRLRLFHHLGSGTVETRLSPDPAVGMAGRCVQGVLDVLESRYGGDPSRMPFVLNKWAFK